MPEDYPSEFLQLFGLLVHTADLYSPTKPVKTALKWVEMINAEFSSQLKEEKEKNYKQSSFFENLDVPLVKARGECFFIQTFILPLWSLADKILENGLKEEIDYIHENLDHWKSVVAQKNSTN